MLANNNLQIHQVTKEDEGVYRCEASVEARGEIDFVDIAVVVNGELHFESVLRTLESRDASELCVHKDRFQKNQRCFMQIFSPSYSKVYK